jgi:hypothetical protein
MGRGSTYVCCGNYVKSGERGKLGLGLATGAYIAFAIDAADFSDDDKAYFRELVEAGIKPILLVRKHLEMSYIETGEYRHRAAALRSDADALHRLTVIDTLGSEFANKHYIWV